MKVATAFVLIALALASCSAPAARPSSSPAPSATPPASGSPVETRWIVYFARDLADPLAVTLPGPPPGPSIEGRLRQRLDVLADGPRTADGGSFNVLAGMTAQLDGVTVAADLVTLDFRVPEDDWGIDGSTMLRAFVQQVVYTASEEAGIARVLVTQNGGRQAVVGGEGLVISAPQSRAGLGHLGLTPDEAARVIRSSVTGARPVLIPTGIPDDWTAAVRAGADTFQATYTDPAGTRTVTLAITLANIPPPTAASSQTAPSFHGDGASLYQIAIAADIASERWLVWTESGTWSMGSRGVAYLLSATGLTDAEFWRLAASLHPNQL